MENLDDIFRFIRENPSVVVKLLAAAKVEIPAVTTRGEDAPPVEANTDEQLKLGTSTSSSSGSSKAISRKCVDLEESFSRKSLDLASQPSNADVIEVDGISREEVHGGGVDDYREGEAKKASFEGNKPALTADELLSKRKAKEKATKAQQAFCVSIACYNMVDIDFCRRNLVHVRWRDGLGSELKKIHVISSACSITSSHFLLLIKIIMIVGIHYQFLL